ncbi:hypothetical protein FSARC_14717 [Fusarium sarcochroum]|uniref:Pyruvate decarboxylase n=1 Tax=Fusarium sarcochroum TaxID=1208366 RepID=A0A8H4WNQ7_9HYPO|nr:hypothetical protein FSARC_14717 [Fusarium sarcochroum]
MTTAPTTVNVAEYLFTRLRQLGCLSVHGVPGDFNLLALDFVRPSGLTWVGSCNELNGGYAADGYARIRGLGAILTTFGVGELSALNAIAGSYAELAPVVHIVGTPSRETQNSGSLVHHTLGNGDFKTFSKIYENVTIAHTNLADPIAAPAQIDHVLQACIVGSRPVYIGLPTDMVTQPADASLLQTPINCNYHKSEPEAETMALDIILDRLYKAIRPVLLVDGAVERRRLLEDTHKLIKCLEIPVFVAPMGKGSVDEDLPNFVGVYAGDGSHPDIRTAFESSDMILTIGNIKSDLNTAGFTYQFSKLSTVDIHYNHVDIGYARFDNVFVRSLLPRLVPGVDPTRLSRSVRIMPTIQAAPLVTSRDDVISHAWFWQRMSQFLQEGDLVVAETGTSYIGGWDLKLPKGARIINQMLWSSIGYGVGATQGVALAVKDSAAGQRTISFEGDGSFQVTAQELATIIRHKLDVTMFLIENGGYTIVSRLVNQSLILCFANYPKERFVHGADAHYNDIPQWQYSKLPSVLTPVGQEAQIKTWKISSRRELDTLLDDKAFALGKGLQASS